MPFSFHLAGILSVLTLAIGVALPLNADDKPKTDAPKQVESKPIDLVLCLDVSSSMDGLIHQAKSQLWRYSSHGSVKT